MNEVRRPGSEAVVVGVDGSRGSVAAIALAAREARYRNAPLIAVQAYAGERLLDVPPEEEAPACVPADVERADRERAERERAAAESRLRETVRDALGDQADQVQLRIVLGLAGRRIVEIARQARAQLIVLAAHGSTSMLLGTVSQYVLRKAPCPVLVVPAEQRMALADS